MCPMQKINIFWEKTKIKCQSENIKKGKSKKNEAQIIKDKTLIKENRTMN